MYFRLLRVAKSRCDDTEVCFDAGATEKPRFDLNFDSNVTILLVFMQWQSLLPTFSLTIWSYEQYLLLYLSCKSSSVAPGAVRWRRIDARSDVTILAHALKQAPRTGAYYRERRNDRARGAVL